MKGRGASLPHDPRPNSRDYLVPRPSERSGRRFRQSMGP